MFEEKNEIYFYQGKNNKVNYDYQLSDILVEIETFLCKNIEKTENLCFLIGSGCSSTAIPLMGKTFDNIKNSIRLIYGEEVLGDFKEWKDIEKY